MGLVFDEGFLFRVGFYVLGEKCLFMFGVVLTDINSLVNFNVSLGNRLPSLKIYQLGQLLSIFLNIPNYISDHTIFFLGLSPAIDSVSLFRQFNFAFNLFKSVIGDI